MVGIINVVVLVAFAVDYLVEVGLARNRHKYVRYEWSSLVIVLTQAIALAPGFQAIGAFRAIRGTREARLAIVALRVIAIGGATAQDSRQFVRKHAAGLALGSAALTWLTAAAAFSIAEFLVRIERSAQDLTPSIVETATSDQ